MATFPFTDVLDVKPTPIDAQDVVSEARIVVAGEYQGDPLSRETTEIEDGTTGDLSYTDILYWPWTVVHTDAAHSTTYRAARALRLPDDYNPWLPTDQSVDDPDNILNTIGVTDPGNAWDGDDDTYADMTGLTGTLAYELVYNPGFANAGLCFGAVLRYEFEPVTFNSYGTRLQVLVAPQLSGLPPSIPRTSLKHTAKYEVELRATNGEPSNIYMITPADIRAADVNLADSGESSGIGVTIRIAPTNAVNNDRMRFYQFHGLVVDDTRVKALAANNIHLPASEPRQVLVSGHKALDDSHTITGWPGGDLTQDVASQTYQGGNTLIEFEQKSGQQVTTALRRERDEQLRQFDYPVRMGSRR